MILPDAHRAGFLGPGPDLPLMTGVKTPLVGVQTEFGGFLLVLGHEFLRSLQGRVHRIKGKVQEKRHARLGRLLDEVD